MHCEQWCDVFQIERRLFEVIQSIAGMKRGPDRIKYCSRHIIMGVPITIIIFVFENESNEFLIDSWCS